MCVLLLFKKWLKVSSSVPVGSSSWRLVNSFPCFLYQPLFFGVYFFFIFTPYFYLHLLFSSSTSSSSLSHSCMFRFKGKSYPSSRSILYAFWGRMLPNEDLISFLRVGNSLGKKMWNWAWIKIAWERKKGAEIRLIHLAAESKILKHSE